MTRCQPSHSKGAQRRRRLARGIARWNRDRELCAEPTRRIATVTLTIPEKDPEAAIGRVYTFLRRVRQQWLGTRYFCWLELQERGAVHYHCVWLNPPHLKRVNLIAWVAKAWGRGRTQVRFSDGSQGLEREVAYAVGYAKKMGRKAHQQRYEDVPRQLRTFMSQRLEIPGPELDLHRDRDIWQPHGEEVVHLDNFAGATHKFDWYLELVAHVEHICPPGARCSALDARRSRAGPTSPLPPGPTLRKVKPDRARTDRSCTNCLHRRRDHRLDLEPPAHRRCQLKDCPCTDYVAWGLGAQLVDRRRYDELQLPLR